MQQPNHGQNFGESERQEQRNAEMHLERSGTKKVRKTKLERNHTKNRSTQTKWK